MKVTQLGLRGSALQAALEYEHKYPDAVFTSGRRQIADQARAMGQNTVLNRKWIVQTYKSSVGARACQAWVDTNPLATTASQLAAGIEGTLKTLSDSDLALLSCHLSGDAFDVQPDGDFDKDEFLKALAVKYGGKFLEKEGGLRRRHWQAKP